MAEFAIWGKELTASEVKAIYDSTRDITYKIKSGIVSLPSRVLLREKDHLSGLYPTILRTGDSNRKGNYNISFNDNDTYVF